MTHAPPENNKSLYEIMISKQKENTQNKLDRLNLERLANRKNRELAKMDSNKMIEKPKAKAPVERHISVGG